MILLPTHACLTDAPDAVAYGELDAMNVTTCIVRVQWETGARLRGCGSRLAVCFGCGLRTRAGETPPPCEMCGATQKPEAMRNDDRSLDGTPRKASAGQDHVGHVPGELVAATAAPGPNPRAGDARTGRPPEAKAPSKPRAPRKTVKKGPAPSDDPMLPGVK